MNFKFIYFLFEIIILVYNFFSLSPLQTIPYTPHSSLLSVKFTASFLINYCWIYTHIYLHIPKYNLFSYIVLLACMFSGLTICLAAVGALFPEGSYFSHSPHSLVACGFWVRLRPCGLSRGHFLPTLECLLLSFLFVSCLGSQVGKILPWCSFWHC